MGTKLGSMRASAATPGELAARQLEIAREALQRVEAIEPSLPPVYRP